MTIRQSVWMWLFLMFTSVAACGVEPGPTTTTSEQAVSAPNAHCVLCGEDDPGNGGGGLLGQAQGYLDGNFPGWYGPIDCGPITDDNGVTLGQECDADFIWHGFPVTVGCVLWNGGGSGSGCGSSI